MIGEKRENNPIFFPQLKRTCLGKINFPERKKSVTERTKGRKKQFGAVYYRREEFCCSWSKGKRYKSDWNYSPRGGKMRDWS